GILISEDPITMYSALDLPPKGLPTVQWDMYTAEDLGYEKFDILSQRGIGHIGDSIKLIAQNKREKVDIHNIPALKEDPVIPDLLEKGETIGCFYVESPAMRSLLKKLQCRDYLSLVAASSIIRPGVSSSGMMHEYIRRFHYPEKATYPHPVLKELLDETFGVMVYQEDVLKVVHHYAGMNLADADILRRAMSGKYRSKTEMQRIVDKFHESAAELGRPKDVTQELWRQIESFSGYSFSKAHSASFAVESYQSLFLKAYYPLEFMVSVINNFGGYYRSWVYFAEAQRLGGKIATPCINRGSYLTTLHGDTLIVGFIHIKSLEEKFIKGILRERQTNGEYASIQDFMDRIPTNREQIILLIRSGSFAFTGKTKPELLWEVFGQAPKKAPVAGTKPMFPVAVDKYELPTLVAGSLEDAYDEMELIGFPVSLTWFSILQSDFRGEIMTKNMEKNVGKRGRMLGVLLTIKPVRTKKNELMYFASFMDAEGHFFEAVHFPQSLKQYPFRGNGTYLLLGKIANDFGAYSIEVEKMAKMVLKPDPRG
ncbi:MAG: DNA polymerase III subunit alpha, partial [Marinilabiliales bacterium]